MTKQIGVSSPEQRERGEALYADRVHCSEWRAVYFSSSKVLNLYYSTSSGVGESIISENFRKSSVSRQNKYSSDLRQRGRV